MHNSASGAGNWARPLRNILLFLHVPTMNYFLSDVKNIRQSPDRPRDGRTQM